MEAESSVGVIKIEVGGQSGGRILNRGHQNRGEARDGESWLHMLGVLIVKYRGRVLSRGRGGGGCPGSGIRTQSYGGLAQSVECVVSNDEAPGSKPGFSTFLFSLRSLVGRALA